MKKIFPWLLKAAAGGIIALCAASLVSFFYHNPARAVVVDDGATNTRYEPGSFWSIMDEGIAFGFTDENGYYNLDADIGETDILVMGSSQMQAVQIFPRDKAPYLLGQYSGRPVYNVGVAGYNFLKCVNDLDSALESVSPDDYVIIESGHSLFTADEIELLLKREMPRDAKPYRGGIASLAQKIPYARLAFYQLSLWNSSSAPAPVQAEPSPASAEDYAALTKYIADTCKKHSVRPVVFYWPSLTLDAEGNAAPAVDENSLELLRQACLENSVVLVDMSRTFMERFESDFTLPNGFCNTEIGHGHLNSKGHEMIARRLAQVIAELDNGSEEVIFQ